MLKKILYPTDFSDVSGKVLPYLESMKNGGTRSVIVLHVLDEKGMEVVFRPRSVHLPGDIGPDLEQKLRAMLREKAEQELDVLRKKLEKVGLRVETRLEWGAAAEKILKIAEGEGVDAIILGSHGKSNFREFLLGSVSENVVRHSKIPVILIKR